MVHKLTGFPVPKYPHTALLNFPVEKALKSERRLIHFIFLGAKLTIAKAWNQPSVSCAIAKRKILWIMAQERMVSILQDTVQRF